eukprot:TRINITY_DN2134_c0_g1_i1.p1 TRINITY_DN2134_c0_g1~~TRINITY_DN2134_c0_g1_i1.p1  ORF type:complete len:299 (+),score=49.06 TRINITY_DN2134_c0_g1_i1:92-988(+)
MMDRVNFLLFCVLYSVAAHVVPETGHPTCYANSVCIDLTNYANTTTPTVNQGFLKECALYEGSATYCQSQVETFSTEFANNIGVYAVYLYTGSLYSGVNKDLRSTPPIPTTYYFTDQALAAGLTYLEQTTNNFGMSTNVVWRGTYSDTDEYIQGQARIEPTFLSTSYSRWVGHAWASNTLLVIANSSGRNIQPISIFSNEDEVLFSAGYQFQVLKVTNFTVPCFGCRTVFMYEIDEVTSKYTASEQQALLDYMIKLDDAESLKPKKQLDEALLKKIAIGKEIQKKAVLSRSKSDSIYS